jgi:hypothetical protein
MEIDVPIRMKTASDVDDAAKHTDPSELQQILTHVTFIPVDRMHDLLIECWYKKRDHIKLLLNWGVTSPPSKDWKLKLFNVAARRLDDAAGDDVTRETDIGIAILRHYPSIITEKLTFGECTALHMAAKARSSQLIDVIFDLARGNAAFDAMLDVRNRTKGMTPLKMAMDNGLVGMTRHILIRNNSPLEDTNILEEALRDGKSDLLQVLIELRPGEMTSSVVARALEKNSRPLIKALQMSTECHHLFEGQEVLHRLVKNGAVDNMELILEKVPKIALELDEKKKKPALWYNSRNEPNIRAQIRAIIAPLIIRQISNVKLANYSSLCGHDEPGVSEVLRALLADTFGKTEPWRS